MCGVEGLGREDWPWHSPSRFEFPGVKVQVGRQHQFVGIMSLWHVRFRRWGEGKTRYQKCLLTLGNGLGSFVRSLCVLALYLKEIYSILVKSIFL